MHIVIPTFHNVSCSCGFQEQFLFGGDEDRSPQEAYSIFRNIADQHASAFRPSIVVRIDITE